MKKPFLLVLVLALGMLWAGTLNKVSPPEWEITSENSLSVVQPVDLALYDDEAFEFAVILEGLGLARKEKELLDLAQLMLDKSRDIGVDPVLFLGIMHVESTFDPCAVSRVGAKGLMQVMPSRIMGYEKAREHFAFKHHRVFEPYWNISFGADYLGELIQRFGSLETALVAYNAGPTRTSYRIRGNLPYSKRYAKRVITKAMHYRSQINQAGYVVL